jgi:hypothetical protein
MNRWLALAVVEAAETAAAAATKDKQDNDDTPTGIISKIKHIVNSISAAARRLDRLF